MHFFLWVCELVLYARRSYSLLHVLRCRRPYSIFQKTLFYIAWLIEVVTVAVAVVAVQWHGIDERHVGIWALSGVSIGNKIYIARMKRSNSTTSSNTNTNDSNNHKWEYNRCLHLFIHAHTYTPYSDVVAQMQFRLMCQITYFYYYMHKLRSIFFGRTESNINICIRWCKHRTVFSW